MSDELYIGLDPSASSLKASGICILNQKGRIIYIGKWFDFSEISDTLKFLNGQAKTVAIDGPLQPPHELDRCCFSSNSTICKHRRQPPTRDAIVNNSYCGEVISVI
jgi:predicted nuclease with RNAse H fold